MPTKKLWSIMIDFSLPLRRSSASPKATQDTGVATTSMPRFPASGNPNRSSWASRRTSEVFSGSFRRIGFPWLNEITMSGSGSGRGGDESVLRLFDLAFSGMFLRTHAPLPKRITIALPVARRKTR